MLLIGTGCAAALFAWNHVRSHSAALLFPANIADAPPQGAYLYAPGTLAAADAGARLSSDSAREQAIVSNAVQAAEDAVRALDYQLQATHSRLAELEREETRAKIIAADAEQHFEQRDSLPGSGTFRVPDYSASILRVAGKALKWPSSGFPRSEIIGAPAPFRRRRNPMDPQRAQGNLAQATADPIPAAAPSDRRGVCRIGMGLVRQRRSG